MDLSEGVRRSTGRPYDPVSYRESETRPACPSDVQRTAAHQAGWQTAGWGNSLDTSRLSGPHLLSTPAETHDERGRLGYDGAPIGHEPRIPMPPPHRGLPD
jgi:hypothetical protein